MEPQQEQEKKYIVDFYTSSYSESNRLLRPSNRLEFLRTQELLRKRLPPAPARILDIGGGTGIHAAWLAQDGYDVELLDLVPAHVEAAKATAATCTRPFTARVCDARSLDVASNSIDVCLLFGPLYHLPDAADRTVTIAEAVRVTRPGGIVCAAAISRYAWPLYELRDRRQFTPECQSAITATIGSGRGDPIGGLPGAYSHHVNELVTEFTQAGLPHPEAFGIEGPGWILFSHNAATKNLPAQELDAMLSAALCTARLCDGHDGIASASAHLFVCARKP